MNTRNTAFVVFAALAGLAASSNAVINFAAAPSLPAAQRPGGAAIADFNADGLADIAVTADAPDRIIIWLRTGDATFAPPISVLTGGTGSRDIATSDIDGDGDMDLVAVLHNTNQVRAFMNSGSGVFTPGSTAQIGADARGLVVADFNGDGRADFAVTNRGSNTVSIVITGPGGILTSTAFGSGGDGPRAVAAGDFDGDGDMDIAVSNHGSRSVAMLPNLGGGVFGAASTFATPDRPEGIAAADIDGDGDADLAVAQDFLVRFYRNTAGVFSLAASIPVGGQDTDAIALADLDGDGDPDAATTDGSLNTVSVLQNNGNFAFELTTLTAGVRPEAIAVGNLGGSTALDLAIPARDSNNVSLFINATAGGPVNLPPIAHAGPDQVVTDLDGNGTQEVTLDGSASIDPDGTITAYVWREGATILGTGAVLTTTLTVGIHAVTLTVTNNNNVSASDAATITVNPGAPRCPADLDDGTGTGTPDGGVTIDDLLYFLMRFHQGC